MDKKISKTYSLVLSKVKTCMDIGLCLWAGADPRGGDWSDRSKTDESNFVHHDFLQCEKHYSRYKAILSSTVLSPRCCDV